MNFILTNNEKKKKTWAKNCSNKVCNGENGKQINLKINNLLLELKICLSTHEDMVRWKPNENKMN